MQTLINDMKARIEKDNGETIYFYVSIPYYDNEVFKCHGRVGDDDHKKFYIDHFLKGGEYNSSVNKNELNITVLIVKGYRGDRFDLEGNVAIGYDTKAFNQGNVKEFILETHKLKEADNV